MTDEHYAIACEPATSGPGPAAVATVRLSGEFDIAACDELRAAIFGVLSAGRGAAVVIDLARVRFIDSETVGVLLDGYTAAQRRGVTYRLVHAHGVVQRVLDITGVTQLLESDSLPAPNRPAGVSQNRHPSPIPLAPQKRQTWEADLL